MKHASWLYSFIFIIFIAVVFFVLNQWLAFLNKPLILSNSQPVTFVFQEGSSVKNLANQLKNLNLIRSSMMFIVLAKTQNAEHVLKAGEYRVDPGDTPLVLLQKIISGQSLPRSFTVVEGWTFKQMLAALGNNQFITHKLVGLKDSEIMERLGFAGEIPEGRFAPETFVFSGNVSDVELLRNSYVMMQKWLNDAWNNRAANLKLHCPYELLIVASIIEKETANVAERPKIAGVIMLRLAKGMRLQVDPTVIYGLGDEYRGKLAEEDLKKDTVYNTYRHAGLPPSPICMPSKSSIDAAAHPEIGTALYFVAKGDGTHVFSNTLKQQNMAIRKYLLQTE